MNDTAIKIARIVSFYDGMREGVALFAYWRDGVQYVGTTGKTLRQAHQEITQEEKEKLEELNRAISI